MAILHDAEMERGVINSRNDNEIQTLAHNRMNALAQSLVASGQAPDLRAALLQIGSADYQAAYDLAGAEDARAQLAAMTGQSEKPLPV